MPYMNSKDPDECVHLCYLTWSFCVSGHTQYPLILDNKSPDQPAPMQRLFRASIVHGLHKGPFLALHIVCLSIVKHSNDLKHICNIQKNKE